MLHEMCHYGSLQQVVWSLCVLVLQVVLSLWNSRLHLAKSINYVLL